MQPFFLNLRHMRAAVATFRGGSLTAAARSVHLTQPAITQGLANLERALGHRLFERTVEGMRPTQAATVVVPRLATALELIGNARVTAAQARAFLTVARAGGYAAAARAAGISTATLHRAVADLGSAYGLTLFERRGDGVVTTRRGRDLARRLSLADRELVSAVDELAELAGKEVGRLTIGAMPLCRARLLPAALSRFLPRYPGFAVAVVEGGYADLVGPLRDGEIDVLIGALRGASATGDLQERPLFTDRPVIVGRAGHPLAGSSPAIAALAGYPWSVAAIGAPLRTHWQRMFDDAGVDAPPVPLECGSVMAIRELLLRSDFLTILSPDQVAAELAAGWLAVIRETPAAVVRTIGTTVRSGWTPTPLQRVLLDELEQEPGPAFRKIL